MVHGLDVRAELKGLFRAATLIFVAMFPVSLCQLTAFSSWSVLVFAGVVTGLLGSLRSERTAVLNVALAALLVALLEPMHASAAFAGLMGVVAPLVLLRPVQRGDTSVAFSALVLPFFLAVNPPAEPAAAQGLWLNSGTWLLPAVFVALGGLWPLLLGQLLGSKMPRSTGVPLSYRLAFEFVGAVAAVLGIVMVLVIALWPDSHAGWVPMTMLIVARPDSSDLLDRAARRTLGTLAGALLSLVVIFTIESSAAQLVIGMLSLVVAIHLELSGRSYSLFAMMLTVVVVLTGATSTGGKVDIGIERLGATLLGAAVVVATLVVVEWLVRVFANHGEIEPD